MGERTAYAPGTFCWADLGVEDRDAAKAFYSGLFGWDHEDQTGPRGNVYTVFGKDSHAVAALREGPAFWLSYVSVDSVDEALARVTEAGAHVTGEPRDVMPAGRLAAVTDPQGAAFGLWEASQFPGAGLVNDVGAMVWQQLFTTDVEAAKAWYSERFAWTWEELEGEGGWSNARNGDRWLVAGAAGLPEPDVPPTWQLIFTVEDCIRAGARVEELGGSVILPRTETPVGGIAVVADSQGSAFGLFDGEPEP